MNSEFVVVVLCLCVCVLLWFFVVDLEGGGIFVIFVRGGGIIF